jgi:hypothetical protein
MSATDPQWDAYLAAVKAAEALAVEQRRGWDETVMTEDGYGAVLGSVNDEPTVVRVVRRQLRRDSGAVMFQLTIDTGVAEMSFALHPDDIPGILDQFVAAWESMPDDYWAEEGTADDTPDPLTIVAEAYAVIDDDDDAG